MNKLFIDITYFSKKPALLGGSVIAKSKSLELLSMVYAIDDGTPVVIDLTKAFTISANLFDALESPNVIKYSFNADVCSALISILTGVKTHICEWRDLIFFGYQTGISARDTNIEWIMSTSYQNVFTIKRYYERSGSKYSGRGTNRPSDNEYLWNAYIRLQSEIIRAMRDYVSLCVIPYDCEAFQKQYENQMRIRQFEPLMKIEMDYNNMDELTRSRLELCNENGSFCNMHFQRFNPNTLLKSITDPGDGGKFTLVELPQVKPILKKYIRTQAIVNINDMGGRVQFEKPEEDILYDTCIYTYLNGIDTRIGNIKISCKKNVLMMSLPTGEFELTQINGHTVDRCNRVQIYTENATYGQVKRFAIGPKIIFKKLTRFVSNSIIESMIDIMLDAEIKVCLNAKTFLICKSDPDENIEEKINGLLLLLPDWINEMSLIPKFETEGNISYEQGA